MQESTVVGTIHAEHKIAEVSMSSFLCVCVCVCVYVCVYRTIYGWLALGDLYVWMPQLVGAVLGVVQVCDDTHTHTHTAGVRTEPLCLRSPKQDLESMHTHTHTFLCDGV